VKYHPLPDNCSISPYVGFGMNVVMPFDEKLTGFNMKVDSSVGWAAKVGADIPIAKNVYLNLDAMYYNTETQMTLQGVGKFDVDINPFIIGTGIGVRLIRTGKSGFKP
jgi:outer membrane protein